MFTGIIQATEPRAIIIVAGILLLLRVSELSRTLGPFVRGHIHRIQDGNGGNGPLDRDEGGAQASELDVAPRVQRPFQDLVGPFPSHLGPEVLGVAKVEAVDGHDQSGRSGSGEGFGKGDGAGVGTRGVSAERSAGDPGGIGRMSDPTHFEQPRSDIIPDVSIGSSARTRSHDAPPLWMMESFHVLKLILKSFSPISVAEARKRMLAFASASTVWRPTATSLRG